MREKFEALGIPVDDFSDAQLVDIGERLALLELREKRTPLLVEIGKTVDEVRFAESPKVASEMSAPVSAAIECAACVPIVVPYPSGRWVVHTNYCPDSPKEKIRRLGHPAGDRRESQRLRTVHEAEDVRSTLIPLKRHGSCIKCGGPATATYCPDCRALLDIVKERA
ncbi:MAG: hypothetical protein ACRDH7_07540 [Actinomycetota bacterium]